MRPMLTTALIVAALAPALAHADQLDDAKAKARLVVVLSDSRNDLRVAKQIQALDGFRPELTDRHIQVLQEPWADGPLRKKLGVEKKGFAVVLVGKDGTVKQIWHDPVDPRTIFTIIDLMPMRQKEMNG